MINKLDLKVDRLNVNSSAAIFNSMISGSLAPRLGASSDCGCRRRSAVASIQGVSRLEDITAGGDFLGLCDQKVHINMCPILDRYGVMTA